MHPRMYDRIIIVHLYDFPAVPWVDLGDHIMLGQVSCSSEFKAARQNMLPERPPINLAFKLASDCLGTTKLGLLLHLRYRSVDCTCIVVHWPGISHSSCTEVPD